MQMLKQYNRLSSARYLCTPGRIILVDVPLDADARKEMNDLETTDGKGLTFLDAEKLAGSLEYYLAEIVENEKNILFVFPGNGANFPKSASNICQKSQGVGVFAKRMWNPGSDPIAVAGIIMPEVFLNLAVQTIVVVDDVISSGQTMYKLHRNNAWRFPRAKWIGATWLAQVPQMRAPSGINGYDRTVAAYMVSGPNKRKAPINSLSTLREDSDIAQNYAKRHFSNPEIFLRLVSK